VTTDSVPLVCSALVFHPRPAGKVERISSANGLPGDRVNCWFQDSEGNLWAGVDHGGLVRLRKKQFQVIGAAEGLQSFAVSTICEDARSNVWLGTFGSGLNRWRDGRLERFNLPEGANRSAFFSANPDAQGRLWLSADREDLFVLETNRIVASPEVIHGIKVILADRQGRIWLGRQNQLTCLTNGGAQNQG
jgi:ligand-binding sensor domain-containing protein